MPHRKPRREPRRCDRPDPGLAARIGRGVRRVFLGRRFLQSVERNRAAADRLDRLMKDIFEQ